MWLYLPDAFVSVVADKTDERLLWVRARRKKDLLRLLPEFPPVRNDLTDYRWRTCVTRAEWSRALERVVRSLDYTNVKGAVTDPEREQVYTRVWGETLRLQKEPRLTQRYWRDF